MKTKDKKILNIIYQMAAGPKCVRCGKPISYGNLYCKACGGTGIRQM